MTCGTMAKHLPSSNLSCRKTGDSPEEGEQADDHIDVPVFGRLSASRLGMPLFTLAIGLVDGFNPCAMWILLFMLSILVNLKDRGTNPGDCRNIRHREWSCVFCVYGGMAQHLHPHWLSAADSDQLGGDGNSDRISPY